MYKGIVFDAYGTLFDVFSVSQKCENEYPGKGDEISKIWRQKQLEYTWLQSLMGNYKNFWQITKDALRFSLNSLKLSYDADKIEDIMSSYFDLSIYPEVTEALQKFGNVKMAILTNGNIEMFRKLMINTGLDKSLDIFLSADTVKVFKPKPAVYQLAVDNLKLDKNEILFISSNGWDIAGAKSFGFNVGWINRSNKIFEELDVKPDYIVSNLLELAQKISKK